VLESRITKGSAFAPMRKVVDSMELVKLKLNQRLVGSGRHPDPTHSWRRLLPSLF